jgi:peptidoglycan L-alanyl-D-glutamate endopeptidase CwlK
MPSKLLRDAEDRLSIAFSIGRYLFELDHPGLELIITATHRSPSEQQALYEQGRTKPGQIVTHLDGVTKLSNHNYSPSRALDFAVVIGGKITWNEAEYKKAGPYFVARGLVWGGNWVSFKDYPHIELPKGDI